MLVSCGVLQLQVDLMPCFRHSHDAQLRAWRPPQHRQVDDGYRTLAFPFDTVQAPESEIRQ